MKGEDGVLLSNKDEVKGVWKRHFERLMNGKTEGEAVVSCMGMEAGGRRVFEQKEISRGEVEKAIAKLKCGKGGGVDGITAEMLKYGGEVIVEWMFWMSH